MPTLVRPKPNLTAQNAYKRGGRRAELQGLRALAVLVVILDHVFHFPTGGFVGVDIFFVLSGFLITGLLLKEYDDTGRISFSQFYLRRIRRILPAASLVLVITCASAFALFTTTRAFNVLGDASASFLFLMNWKLAFEGTDYMNAGESVSPLQHYWSLSVEEQFYFVWPWILLAAAVTYTKLYRRPTPKILRILAGSLIGAICISSAIWAYFETKNSPTVAYFSTASRAWELGLGALLAVCSPLFAALPRAIRTLTAFLGLAGLTVSVFVINPSTAFPVPGALIPVLSTALIIAANSGGSAQGMQLLTNPVSRYIGDISFSLYLWHFPVIVFAEILSPTQTTTWYAVVCTTILLLSVFSYHIVEKPIHQSPLLERHPSRHIRQRAWIRWRASNGRSIAAWSIAALAGLTVGITAASLQAAAGTNSTITAPLDTLHTLESGEVSERRIHEIALSDAASSSVWPDLTPTVEELGPASKAPEWVVDDCLLSANIEQLPEFAKHIADCSYGSPKNEKTAILFGDSMAISYAPGIRAALEPEGYTVIVLTMEQCPAAWVTMLTADGAAHPACDTFRERAMENIVALRPDVLVMSSSHGASNTLASKASGRAAIEEWQTGMSATVERLADSAMRTLIIDAPPGGQSLSECKTRLSAPSACSSSADEWYFNVSAATSLATAAPSVTHIETHRWFCNPSNICPSFIGNTPVYADKGHITAAMAEKLAPLIRQVIAENSGA